MKMVWIEMNREESEEGAEQERTQLLMIDVKKIEHRFVETHKRITKSYLGH